MSYVPLLGLKLLVSVRMRNCCVLVVEPFGLWLEETSCGAIKCSTASHPSRNRHRAPLRPFPQELHDQRLLLAPWQSVLQAIFVAKLRLIGLESDVHTLFVLGLLWSTWASV